MQMFSPESVHRPEFLVEKTVKGGIRDPGPARQPWTLPSRTHSAARVKEGTDDLPAREESPRPSGQALGPPDRPHLDPAAAMRPDGRQGSLGRRAGRFLHS